MTPSLRRRIGFEIELMAPQGRSRRSLAYDLAGRIGGRIRPVWHHDSEPSLVPGLGRFLHLTQGFEVLRADGSQLCTLVDDITLRDGLEPRTPAPPGWYRVLSDDSIRLAVKRLGVSWRRAKHWIRSPDPAYARKKKPATA